LSDSTAQELLAGIVQPGVFLDMPGFHEGVAGQSGQGQARVGPR
jgi:hypothetical protein